MSGKSSKVRLRVFDVILKKAILEVRTKIVEGQTWEVFPNLKIWQLYSENWWKKKDKHMQENETC